MEIKQLYRGRDKVGDLLRERLHLSNDVVTQLLQADDWAMMILAWALVEGCLNQAITNRLGEQLSPFVERLNINGRSGKAELALELGLINKADQKFLDKYSTVRNSFAHGVRRFQTTFDDYFNGVSNVIEYENVLLVRSVAGDESAGKAAITFQSNKRTLILLSVITLCLKITAA
jgi:hypothetical protein